MEGDDVGKEESHLGVLRVLRAQHLEPLTVPLTLWVIPITEEPGGPREKWKVRC